MTAGEELTAHTIGRYFWYNGDYYKNIKVGICIRSLRLIFMRNYSITGVCHDISDMH